MKAETVGLTHMQLTELFNKDKTVITKHINNILVEELEKDGNVQKI